MLIVDATVTIQVGEVHMKVGKTSLNQKLKEICKGPRVPEFQWAVEEWWQSLGLWTWFKTGKNVLIIGKLLSKMVANGNVFVMGT